MPDFDPRTLVRQYVAAVNARDVDRVAALCDANAIVQDMSQQQVRTLFGEIGPHIPQGILPRGRAGLALYWGRWFEALPDLRLVMYGLTAGASGAALEFTFQGTHRGDFLGMPGAGARIGCQAVAVFSFLGDKIHECRLYYDLATLERQMGGRMVEGAVSETEERARQRAVAQGARR